ncbi:hypothetical protein F2Q70_00039984 [Brassica cretica]|uniref:Uncharacterized protein n=1 Tax=Brassica cretica TaxID=69181 RepID=A0A8S9K9J7_BRACR|nr:hypothetical protein F2Q70_00039984 [Brassica cretica]
MAAGCARRAESWSTRDVPERGDAARSGGRSVRRQRGLKLAPPLEEPVDGFRARYRSERGTEAAPRLLKYDFLTRHPTTRPIPDDSTRLLPSLASTDDETDNVEVASEPQAYFTTFPDDTGDEATAFFPDA